MCVRAAAVICENSLGKLVPGKRALDREDLVTVSIAVRPEVEKMRTTCRDVLCECKDRVDQYSRIDADPQRG